MRPTVSRLLATLFLLGIAGTAHAVQYPPPGCSPCDTLIEVNHIQNPIAVPHPVEPDTVWGIAGIITGFDPIGSGFGFYIQNSNGGPWTGVDVFTGGSNYQGLYTPPLAIGDSVVTYGRLQEFEGGLEIRSFSGGSPFNPPQPIVRRISQGNALPPFHIGTVAELQELPTNPNAEQWEGTLVRVNGPLKVARLFGNFGYLAVVNSCATQVCDSMFVDTGILAGIPPPPIGSIISFVQGIYEQRARGYRIQIRDGNDFLDTSPPRLLDAYPIEDNTIRVVFDRATVEASAESLPNYTMGSLRSVTTATQVTPTAVELVIAGASPDGADESVTVNRVRASSNNVSMTPDTRNFVNGVLTVTYLQGPSPDSLASTSGCKDYMRHLGPANGSQWPGDPDQPVRLTVRGVATLNMDGQTFFFGDAAGGQRSGMQIFAPSTPLVAGRQYTIAAQPAEFFTESQVSNAVFIRDDGPATLPPVSLQTVHVLADTSAVNPAVCATPAVVNGEDYEGVLVRVECVQVERNGLAGENFRVTGPFPTFVDSILIDNNTLPARTYVPVKGRMINVNGLLDLSFGTYRIQPRGDSDITPCTQAGVDGTPGKVSFSVYPNPSPSAQVSFGLPRPAKVELAIYDLLGRRLAVLAKGEYPAGQYQTKWNGRLSDGSEAGSGVFFYRLKVNDEVFKLRSVRVD